MGIVNTIRSLIRLARITSVGIDDKDFPNQQVGYLGKVGDAVMWFPYGFTANVPIDELALIFSVGANSESRIAFPSSPKLRIKPIKAGEIVIFHPLTGAKIHFKTNGNIDIETAGGVNVIAVNVNVITDIVNIDSPDINLGTGTLEKLMNESAMAVYNSHQHSGGPVPDQQMVAGTDTTSEVESS